jgi:uncharacterized protein
MNRRTLLKSLAVAPFALGFAGTGYCFFEAGWIQVVQIKQRVPRLPKAFDGLRVAFLTDVHNGPYNDDEYLRTIVRTTNLMEPDVILHGGDYSVRDKKYILPCFDILKELRAPLGQFGVLGNHDYAHGLSDTKLGMKRAKITELTNANAVLNRDNEQLRLIGVDDHLYGKVDLAKAMIGTSLGDCCVMLSHNPDVAETLDDRRIGFVLSGHTHGGQVNLPGYGPPWLPSKYGAKYLKGLVRAPEVDVYISRGLGVSSWPVRFQCRPEITLVTLTV